MRKRAKDILKAKRNKSRVIASARMAGATALCPRYYTDFQALSLDDQISDHKPTLFLYIGGFYAARRATR